MAGVKTTKQPYDVNIISLGSKNGFQPSERSDEGEMIVLMFSNVFLKF